MANINFRLGTQVEHIKEILDRTEALANVHPVLIGIERKNEYFLTLYVPGCSPLVFDFNKFSKYKNDKDGAYIYEKETLEDVIGLMYLDSPDISWTSGFCETDLKKYIDSPSNANHRVVIELIKSVAMCCEIAVVTDQADYYCDPKFYDVI